MTDPCTATMPRSRVMRQREELLCFEECYRDTVTAGYTTRSELLLVVQRA